MRTHSHSSTKKVCSHAEAPPGSLYLAHPLAYVHPGLLQRPNAPWYTPAYRHSHHCMWHHRRMRQHWMPATRDCEASPSAAKSPMAPDKTPMKPSHQNCVIFQSKGRRLTEKCFRNREAPWGPRCSVNQCMCIHSPRPWFIRVADSKCFTGLHT